MIFLSLGTHLNAQTWAAALARLPDRPLSGERLLIDLTELGFADFVTLGHLLVFVRATVASGAECLVRLPSAEVLPSGTASDSRVAQRLVKRHNCRLYLEQTGVVDALRPHLDNEQVSVADELEVHVDGDVIVAPPTSGRPHRYRRILRYQWLPCSRYRDITRATWTTDEERRLRELGVPAESAAAVARGIILELLENAAHHSGEPEILLGAVVVDPQTYRQRSRDFDPALVAFAENAAETDSPMIRLVVADVGTGVASGIAALDKRSAGSIDAAQGLWKVGQLVRAYQGSLLLTTAGRAEGRAYFGGQHRELVGQGAAESPGTFIECDVLVRPGETVANDAGQLPTPRLNTAADRRELQCVAVSVDSEVGLNAVDQAAIRRGLSDKNGVVVVVNLPHGGQGGHDVDIGRTVNQAIDIVSSAGGAGTATLAFPSVNRPLMAVAVEYLNAERDERGGEVPPPILVLAPDNRHYWVGGTSTQRQVLARLSIATGSLPLSDLPTEEVDSLVGLVTVDGDRVALRTPPQTAVAAMAIWVGRQLASAIAEPTDKLGPAAVWRGRFLTPSLRQTSRWFDPDALLSRLNLSAVAGVTLAAHAEGFLGTPADRASTTILRLAHTPKDIVVAVARAVTGRDDYHDSVHEISAGSRRAQVLLVSDVVSSGTTLIGTLTDLFERGMKPVGVAAVIDARAESERVALPEHIELAGHRIPLFSLAVVNVEADEPEAGELKPIDPVLRRPESVGRPIPRQLIDQKAYLRAMKRNAATRLGHIERPADRHYTAYVDPTLLFREEEWSQLVLGTLVEEIGAHHRAKFDQRKARISVLYPEGTADDLTAVAWLVRDALRDAGLQVDDPVPVPRAAHAANWQLPESVSLPTVEHAVILDSGANSGRTIRQLIGLAADKESLAITVVLLLNGQSDGDAVNLQRIAKLRRSSSTSRIDEADLSIHYVARTARAIAK
ncbi:hypothetical protein [Micromonospora sp. NPDC047134]|uniref:hypothetical protein n=1 Tax=Micromonospora sp. NPDC047134 TaxID=3154340 RepID=UPI0033C30084